MSATPAGPAAALARGLAVFPIPPGERKAPPGWQARASRAPDQPWPAGCNVGVGCRASGVVVIDLDRKNGVDGVVELERICRAGAAPWPQTFTIATANAGLHLYFIAPHQVVVSTIATMGPGIDVRAPGRTSGGYVIGPGSVVDGCTYTIAHDLPIAPVPRWLANYLGRTSRTSSGWPGDSVPRTKIGDRRVSVARTPNRFS